jgi:hypothetical protein
MTIARGEPMLADDILHLTFFPIGTILIFSGTAYSDTENGFKAIWKICNGRDGTPNLVGKFLRGGEISGQTGDGRKTLTVAEIPKHTHKIIDPGHTHQQEPHSHSFDANKTGGGYVASSVNTDRYPYGTQSVHSTTAVNKSNNTGISGTEYNDEGGNSFEVIPAYYQVIYVMRVA